MINSKEEQDHLNTQKQERVRCFEGSQAGTGGGQKQNLREQSSSCDKIMYKLEKKNDKI